MKKIKKICLLLLILIAMVSIKSVNATEEILPTAYDNLNVGLISRSELVAVDSGYMRVFFNGSTIGVEYYDSNFNVTSKRTIGMELNIWGGFFAGQNAYYVVEGQNNTAENNSAEVIRVIKYDKNWNKLGDAKISSNTQLFGGEVRYPFDAGCVNMTEHNGNLYIVTGHEGYVDEAVGQGHQGFLMIKVDESSMTGKIIQSDLWHSFAQYIDYKDSNFYVLEQSEGSRYTKLTKYDENGLEGESIPVLKYGGARDSAWAVSCYSSVDDMAISSNNVLCLGTSIDQSKYDSVVSGTDVPNNIYLTVTPMNNFSEEATTVKWLTDFKDGEKSFLGTKITKITDNRFMVSWEEFNSSKTAKIDDTLSGYVLHYVFINENGEKIGNEYEAEAPISECHPIVNGSKIVYYASSANMVNFYSIDAYNGSFNKKTYRVAGEHATWNIDNDTIIFSGTGEIAVDGEAKYRYPVSSTSYWFSYSSNDNAWKPVRDKVKKMIINKGITSISDNAFCDFDSLTEVTIEDGLQSIGKKAFYSCGKLNKITIPNSVTSIGEDCLWTGSYWVPDHSHVVHATIYAQADSYAIKYAKQNNINYELIGNKKLDIASTKISSIKTQNYTGKEIKPSITIKDENTTLINGIDYTVSYKNNKNPGKATATIKGKGNYTGTVTRTFTIAVRKVSGLKAKSQTTSSITLSWSKASGVSKYQLYKYNSSKKKWEKVTTTSKTSYTVKKLKEGTTYKFRIRAYKTISKKNYYGSYSSTLSTATKTKTPKISKITSKSKKATISWKKVSGASGYQIYMATSKKGKYSKVKTITSGKTVKYTKSSLKKKKTYYFKIRTYKTVSGKKIYSSYSSIKNIKVK